MESCGRVLRKVSRESLIGLMSASTNLSGERLPRSLGRLGVESGRKLQRCQSGVEATALDEFRVRS